MLAATLNTEFSFQSMEYVNFVPSRMITLFFLPRTFSLLWRLVKYKFSANIYLFLDYLKGHRKIFQTILIQDDLSKCYQVIKKNDVIHNPLQFPEFFFFCFFCFLFLCFHLDVTFAKVTPQKKRFLDVACFL